MESLPKDLTRELVAIVEERKETIRADGKSEKEFIFTHYPEAYVDPSTAICGQESCYCCERMLDWEEFPHLIDQYNHENVKRFDRKRWELFWRKVVLERYTDVALAPVKSGMHPPHSEKEMTRVRFQFCRSKIHGMLIDRFFKENKNILNNFWEPKQTDFPIERMMERRRYYELMFWESISFSAYYPKFANLDEDKRKMYNAENFFSERKRLTRSKLPVKTRSFGLFIQRLHTTPYSEEYRIPRRVPHKDFPNGLWTAEPLRNEKGEAKMHPVQGHRQNFMVELSRKVWGRFNEETPIIVCNSIEQGPDLSYPGFWFKTTNPKWVHTTPDF